jgi:hypothetical protein
MSKCILVVEDQPDNRQIIRDMLAPLTVQHMGFVRLAHDDSQNTDAQRTRSRRSLVTPKSLTIFARGHCNPICNPDFGEVDPVFVWSYAVRRELASM